MNVNFALAEENASEFQIGHLPVTSVPVNPDGTPGSTLAPGSAVPADFVQVDTLPASGPKKKPTGGRQGGGKKRQRESSPDSPVHASQSNQDTGNMEDDAAGDDANQERMVLQLRDTSTEEEVDDSSSLTRKKGKKKRVVASADAGGGSRTSGSHMSFGDMDEEDDGVDFLGGARRAIPFGPWENTENSPVFVPGWGYQEDNPGCDLHSVTDYVRHAMPPGIAQKMAKLTPPQAFRRFAKSTFDNFMFSINTMHLADQADRMNRKMAASVKETRAKAVAEAEKIRAERESFQKFKEDHEADLAKVNEMATEIEALKARLQEQEGKCLEMESSLQRSGQELNVAITEKIEMAAARDQALAERDQAIAERDEARAEKKKLQGALPEVVISAFSCPGVSVPVGKVVYCARKQGQTEVARLSAKYLDPLPAEIAAKLDPEAGAKAKAAAEVLQNMQTCPYLEKLTEDLDMPVDDLLKIKP